MALGPGKYDDLCTKLRTEAKAAGVLLVVLRGDRGDGFSAQGPPEMLLTLAAMLRHVADEIEQWGPGA
jgi:hypothetical protein